MKFLIDAQLPRRLARWLNDRGFDEIHTFDLPSGNASTDQALIAYADLAVVFTLRQDQTLIRVISARAQHRKERLIYDQVRT